jgi:hypothetical protein
MVREDWEAIKELIGVYLNYHNKVVEHKFASTRVESARKELNDIITIIESGITFNDESRGTEEVD